MKTGLCVAFLIFLPLCANAQSNVTLYGRLDSGIEYMSGIPNTSGGTTSRIRAESGDWGTSMLGFTGAEDLGSGTKAVFHLETGFNAVNGVAGNGTSFFQRWATVGASNSTFGTLLLGRELFISNTGLNDFDPLGQSNWSSASLVRGRNWPASSNNISWQSKKWNGFELYGQYAFSNAINWNGNGTTPQGREDGVHLTYSNAWIEARGMYDEIRNSANGALDDVFQFSREYFVGLNVFVGQFKMQAGYQASRTSAITQSTAGAPTTTDQEWGGLTWQATPAASLVAAAYHVNSNNGGGNATLYTIGGTYALSKRTILDFQAATVRNSKSGTYSLEANLPGNTDNPILGHAQSGIYAGIEHSF